MNSIDAIQERVLEISQPQQRIVRGLWSTDCFYNPDHNGRIFDYKFIVTQTVGQGCAYSLRYDYDRKDLLQYVGKDCLEQPVSDVATLFLTFVVVRSILSQFKKMPDRDADCTR